ncbi:mediator of RNA polymerase II transcription subunit 22 isoform X3 [Drosophila ficusphila]|uniref:mediator of RNA polymerase II transcription subunit 22 isoform X3 n=1 Tax=Drosophila ficusphila TaxID=30025 RepID=UPI0007E5D646|nr:mediator of RNA polymerase II transcription subunit 22 isoform X3 [Drosophila ficusphila]
MASGSRTTILPQSKEALLKSYNARLKDDVRSMLENFDEILKLARRESHSQISKTTQCEQDALEMQFAPVNH